MIGDIIQPTHLIFILVVALLVLGPKRLPEVGRSLGRGIRDFRDAMTNSTSEARELIYGEQALGVDHTPTGRARATTTATVPLTSSSSLAAEPATASTAWSEPAGGEAGASASTAWPEPGGGTGASASTAWPEPGGGTEASVSAAWSDPGDVDQAATAALSKPSTSPAARPAGANGPQAGETPLEPASELSSAEPVYGD